jgi:CBS domain-containing protein
MSAENRDIKLLTDDPAASFVGGTRFAYITLVIAFYQRLGLIGAEVLTMNKCHIPLKDIISTDVVSIDPHDTLRDALSMMVENRVSALPVVNSRQHCVGVISVTDLLGMTKDLSDELNALSESGGLDHAVLVQKLEHADLLTELVQDLMSTEVISVRVDATLQHAARQMLRNHVHRLVVLDDQRQIVGVVSTMDLLAAFADEQRNGSAV